MKKAFSIILSLVPLCSLAVSAMAATEPVVYTSDSSFVAGGTVKVNEQKNALVGHPADCSGRRRRRCRYHRCSIEEKEMIL